VASSRPRTRPNGSQALTSILLPYGLALLTIGAALLLMKLLQPISGDTWGALLVPIAVSALYGGVGPGLLALVIAVGLARDPMMLVAGAVLVAVCASFRRPRSAPTTKGGSTATELPEVTPSHPFEHLEASSGGFPPEVQRVSPSFAELTTEATWRFQHEQPLDITLPEDEQVEHLYLYSVLAECNDAFARMYGFRAAADVIGTRLVVFLPPSNPENVAYLRSFIRSGYRLEDAQSHEIDRYGNAKDFVNNLVGIFERGQLVGAWGTQRDVTGRKADDDSQEYRSRVHSSKSSSQ
jgi:hypothetical protein